MGGARIPNALLAVEGAFKSEGIHDVEVSEHNYPAGRFLCLFNFEAGASETETLVLVAAQ